MITPPTSGTMITRKITLSVGIVEMVVVSIIKSPSKGAELVVGGVDVVVGGILLNLVPRVPGTMSLNLAASGTKPIVNDKH